MGGLADPVWLYHCWLQVGPNGSDQVPEFSTVKTTTRDYLEKVREPNQILVRHASPAIYSIRGHMAYLSKFLQKR